MKSGRLWHGVESRKTHGVTMILFRLQKLVSLILLFVLVKEGIFYRMARGDWDGDGIPDLFAIRTSGAASGMVEVHFFLGNGG